MERRLNAPNAGKSDRMSSGENEGEDKRPSAEEGASSQQGGGSGSGDDSYPEEKPVKVGQELDVLITETSRRGDGIARVEGFVVFVRNGTQGEQAKVRITAIKPNFAVAELVQANSTDF
jgi:predicted RNA-binding protein with TRAM domain